MEIALAIIGVCFVLLMLVLVAWLAGLDERVARLEGGQRPREHVDDLLVLPPARRRSSGAE